MPEITRKDIKAFGNTAYDYGKYVIDTPQWITWTAIISASAWQIKRYQEDNKTQIINIEDQVHGSGGRAWPGGPFKKYSPAYTSTPEGQAAIEKIINDHGGHDAVEKMLLKKGKAKGLSYPVQPVREWAMQQVRENRIDSLFGEFTQSAAGKRILLAVRNAAIFLLTARTLMYVFGTVSTMKSNEIEKYPETSSKPAHKPRNRE